MVGIAKESISRNEKCLWISLDVGRRTSRLSEKPILLAARSLTSVIPLQTKLCTHLLWFWSMAEVYDKRKVLCTTLAPSFPLRNANWKRLQSKIVSSNFLKDATLRRKWSKYFIPRWHLDLCLPSNVFGDICRRFPEPKMITEGDYVILKKENVIRAVKVRKGR